MMSAGMSGVAGGVSVGLEMSMTVIDALVARSDVSVSESAVKGKVIVSDSVLGETGGLEEGSERLEGEAGGLVGELGRLEGEFGGLGEET